MRGTQGALIVASTLQIIVGFSGLWRHVTRFSMRMYFISASCDFILSAQPFCFLMHYLFRYLSPLGAAPLIALAGFGFYELGFPRVRIYFAHSNDLLSMLLYFVFSWNSTAFSKFCDCHSFLFVLLFDGYAGCKMCWDWATVDYCVSDILTGNMLSDEWNALVNWFHY